MVTFVNVIIGISRYLSRMSRVSNAIDKILRFNIGFEEHSHIPNIDFAIRNLMTVFPQT